MEYVLRTVDVLSATADDFQLGQFSAEELCDIYCNLNSWLWDSRLGVRPYGCDTEGVSSPEHLLIFSIIGDSIEEIVGHKTILKYHNTKRHNYKTEEQFEVWYENMLASNGFRRHTLDFTEKYRTRLRKQIARKRIKALFPVSISGLLPSESKKKQRKTR